MIEYFRHEAMNQATVISGFCEIIGNLIAAPEVTVDESFPPLLQKIRELILTFHETLMMFRDECTLENSSEEVLFSADATGDFTRFLSPGCSMHYAALRDIVKVLAGTVQSIDPVSIGSDKIITRFQFITESITRLTDLLENPVGYLQNMIRTNQPQS